MTAALALEQARALYGGACDCDSCRTIRRKIAADRMRAYADGFEDGRTWSRSVTTATLDPPTRIRAEAAALDRGEPEERPGDRR